MKFRKLISGISAFAVAASAFAGFAVTASAAVGDKTEVYSGTPTWTALGGTAESATNCFGLDASSSVEAAAHVQGGGSGGRSAYSYFADVTPTTEQNVEVEFYLNIRGSNTNASDFYLMSEEKKVTNNVPGSGVILDIAYTSYLGTVTVNGTPITNLPKARDAAHQPGPGSVYDATGLVKYDVLLNYNAKQAAVTVYGNTTETYTVSFVDSSVTGFKGFFSLLGRAQAGCSVYDVHVSTVEAEAKTYYSVAFDVEGTTTNQTVLEGDTVSSVPETVKEGYIFKGWNKDEDTETFYSASDVAAMAITADTKFTAVFEADEAYIEPMAKVEFNAFPSDGKLVAGADENTAESNPISVKVTGNIGTDLLATPDSRIDAPVVTYDFKGFRWVASKNEPTTDDPESDIYCDSYGEAVKDGYAVDFRLKSHPFNYYGEVTATVTYNGQTMSVSRPLVYIGNPAKASANDILPRGGYVSDFDRYSDDMVGYKLTTSSDNRGATDIVADNWAAYGGNTGRGVYIASEDNKKFLKLKSTGSNSSSFAANVIDTVTDSQIIVSQNVRFYNSSSTILLKSVNPVTWTAGAATTFSVNFTGTQLNINGNYITDATTGVWYNVVVSSDVSSGKCFAIVNDMEGNKLGESEIVNFSDAGSVTPKFLCYRTPDNSQGELDFNDVRVYRATTDQSSMSINASTTTLAIPEAGEPATTADLSVSAKTTDGYEAIGVATWTVEDEPDGITITPSAEDSHNAVITVDSAASAATNSINVSIGGVTKTIEITTTASKDSIKFASPTVNSVSIPMDDNVSETAYAASVIDKDGNDIAGKTVTLSIYDKNNISPASFDGITLENGVLKVTNDAKPCVLTIRATSTNSNGEEITNAVKVTIHGMAIDFGAGTDEDTVSGYTPVSPSTTYSDKQGYGIEGSATVGGTASLEDVDSDDLRGTFVFKAKVPEKKIYSVKINYSGTAAFENMSTDLSGVVRSNAAKSEVTYLTYVHDGVLDINFSDAVVSSLVIEKVDDKSASVKPNIYTVGDSTIANNGSWAYVLNRDQANYPELTALATFSNNGRGGKNLSSYYTGGELWDRVLTNIKPGDYVMIGDMGTNGMGDDFRGSFTYYVDACLALGAKVILNSYSPHGAVGGYASGYNSETHTFDSYRKDSYDNIVRDIYETRKGEFAGFVDIGKNADKAFNAYVADYAANGYDSADAAAQAIIACFGDHNHYSNGALAAKLMVEGYNGTEGIVSELVRILTAGDTPQPPAEGIEVKSFDTKSSTEDVAAVGAEVTNNTDAAITVELIMALKDADGKLVSVSMETAEIAAGEAKDVSTSINIMNDQWTTVKAYLWNASDNNAPLANILDVLSK